MMNRCFPNQFVNAKLLVNTLHNVTLLPNTAIQRNADSAFVYTIQPFHRDETNQDQTAANSMGSTASAGNAGSTNQMASITLQTITVGTTDGNVSAG